jgi:hypothetical protein
MPCENRKVKKLLAEPMLDFAMPKGLYAKKMMTRAVNGRLWLTHMPDDRGRPDFGALSVYPALTTRLGSRLHELASQCRLSSSAPRLDRRNHKKLRRLHRQERLQVRQEPNRRLRDELLNETLFAKLADARVALAERISQAAHCSTTCRRRSTQNSAIQTCNGLKGSNERVSPSSGMREGDPGQPSLLPEQDFD